MESSSSNYLIPENIKGKHTSVEHVVNFDTRQEAVAAFTKACKRMLHINGWQQLAGIAYAGFSLKDATGEDKNSPAEEGDYIQIDIPGPGPGSGDGYDWVNVELIDDHSDPQAEEESMGLRVRSSKNPKKESDETAHFFTDDATSIFIIHRKNDRVTASYHGRNEILNTKAENVKDKVRNALVGASAFVGVSELQWKRLVKAFLENAG